MNVINELKKLELLVKYANKLVSERGVKELERLGTLDVNIDTNALKSLLNTRQIFAKFKGDKGVVSHERSTLHKRIYGKCHYITLLDPLDDDFIYPDVGTYSVKFDIDECKSIISVKRMARKMIKVPDYYYIASSSSQRA